MESPFDLPPRRVFEPPSYPNIWFHVHEEIAASQADAVRFVTGWLAEHCGLVNDFGGFKPPEGSDSQARAGGLQPWTGSPDPGRNHTHDLHIRYYYVALRQTGHERVTLGASEHAGWFFRFAGSVHYEVADEHPLHPYVDDCPYCGRAGEYASAADLFAGAHEPLGLELLLYGTNHGRPVMRRDGRPVEGLRGIEATHGLHIRRLLPWQPDMNVVALAAVVITLPTTSDRR